MYYLFGMIKRSRQIVEKRNPNNRNTFENVYLLKQWKFVLKMFCLKKIIQRKQSEPTTYKDIVEKRLSAT